MSNGQHQGLFQPELLRGETIKWTGQPDPSVNFTKGDIFLVPFGLIFAGFSLVWFWDVVRMLPTDNYGSPEFPTGLIILGGLFAIVGLYAIFGRFIFKKWNKRRTFYALTDRRALVLTRTFGRKIEAVFLDNLASLNKAVRSNGVGTIVFGNSSWHGAVHGNSGLNLMSGFYSGDVPTFYDIRDADSVYDLVNRLR